MESNSQSVFRNHKNFHFLSGLRGQRSTNTGTSSRAFGAQSTSRILVANPGVPISPSIQHHEQRDSSLQRHGAAKNGATTERQRRQYSQIVVSHQQRRIAKERTLLRFERYLNLDFQHFFNNRMLRKRKIDIKLLTFHVF